MTPKVAGGRAVVLLVILVSAASAQVFSSATISGKYFARHIEFTTSSTNTVTDARSVIGVMTFNGSGNYSFTGQQVIGTGTAASYSSSGTYSVGPGGNVTLTNPQNSVLSINGRYGVEAVVGSGTETSGNTFDLFVAIPAPSVAETNGSIGATGGTAWSATNFELTSASTAQVRDSIVSLSFDGAGNIATLTLSGHAANLNSGANTTETVVGGTYSVGSDGSGAITFPLPSGVSGAAAILSPTARTLYVSKSGNLILAGTPGAHDLFIAVRNTTGAVTLTNGQRYWNTGIRVDSSGSSDSYTGSSTTLLTQSSFVSSRRLHETGASAFNVTEAATFTVALDGTGSAGATKIAVETAGTIGANNGNELDPTGYEIQFGVAIPPVSGSGVFVNPQGIVNAASNAPAGDAISPGEFIAIYGTGLAAANTSATTLPFPMSLGGVSVSIGGLLAPVYFAGQGQINCIVPYGVTGQTAVISVTSNNVVSNAVTVNVATTSPGVFSIDGSGTGDGAITHADNSLVNAASPAVKGETVVMYVSGLGALTTPVKDGYGATALDNAATQLAIYISGVPVPASGVVYQGLTADAGLYQINFTIPTNLTVSGELPLAILTPDGFTDEANIAIQ
jgi:uncharacterized protein (TIGR03437 family)